MYVPKQKQGKQNQKTKSQKSIKSKLIFTGNSNPVSIKLVVARESEFSKKNH